MQIKPVGSSWVMSWNSSWELFFPPNVQESFPQNVSGESSPNPNSETTYMECQERFCHGLIAVHFRAQRRQTRKNSRQKEEEEKIQILPANGKLHQTSSNSSSAVRGWNWIPVANFPRQNPLQIFVTVLLLLYLLLLLLLLLCPGYKWNLLPGYSHSQTSQPQTTLPHTHTHPPNTRSQTKRKEKKPPLFKKKRHASWNKQNFPECHG